MKYLFYCRIRNIEESGISLKWKKHHFPVDKCSIQRKLEQLKSHPITFRQVTASFLILSVGITLGTASFLIECLWIKIRRKLHETPIVNFVNHLGRKTNFLCEKKPHNFVDVSEPGYKENNYKHPEVVAKLPKIVKVNKQTFFTWK